MMCTTWFSFSWTWIFCFSVSSRILWYQYYIDNSKDILLEHFLQYYCFFPKYLCLCNLGSYDTISYWLQLTHLSDNSKVILSNTFSYSDIINYVYADIDSISTSCPHCTMALTTVFCMGYSVRTPSFMYWWPRVHCSHCTMSLTAVFCVGLFSMMTHF